ncbi:MAG: hypothetical protein PHC61_01695 [Chitinivibrionales bacterium]|nr:hypothetical protein [Chitinivibrionales bacterium]
MNGINRFWAVVAVMLLCLNCDSRLTASKYVHYFEKNRADYSKVVKRNGVVASVAYIPIEYYAARAVQFDSTLPVDSAMKRYDNSVFFVLTVRPEKGGSQSVLLERDGMEGFKDNVYKNTFNKEHDIFLLNGKDTANTVSCDFERNWGISNDDAFLIGFSKKSIKSDFKKYHLIIRDVTELGTIDIQVKDLVGNYKRLRG